MEHTTRNTEHRIYTTEQTTCFVLHDRRGFIKIILLIVIGLVVLGYFGLNIKDILASPVVKENLAYAWELAKTLWANYLQVPAQWVWDHLIKFLWNLFLEGLGNLKSN